jgi:protoheme ferro-lyase
MVNLVFKNWQSQVGPSKWLGPQTSDAIIGYAGKKIKELLLIPVAFVSGILGNYFRPH